MASWDAQQKREALGRIRLSPAALRYAIYQGNRRHSAAFRLMAGFVQWLHGPHAGPTMCSHPLAFRISSRFVGSQ